MMVPMDAFLQEKMKQKENKYFRPTGHQPLSTLPAKGVHLKD